MNHEVRGFCEVECPKKTHRCALKLYYDLGDTFFDQITAFFPI